MNPTCQYCGVGEVAIHLGWTDSCPACVFECTTCHMLRPYEMGIASSSECDQCVALEVRLGALEVRLDSDMVFSIQGFTQTDPSDTPVADFFRQTQELDATPTTTQEQGETPQMNRLYTVISFDDQTQQYQVVGTTTSQIEPEELTDLLDTDTDKTEFQNVIADFINAEVEKMVALALSQDRARNSRMRRAEHKQVFMRMGEWNSLLHALRAIKWVENQHDDVHIICPSNAVPNGVTVDTLIESIEKSLQNTDGVMGNA